MQLVKKKKQNKRFTDLELEWINIYVRGQLDTNLIDITTQNNEKIYTSDLFVVVVVSSSSPSVGE